MEVVSADKEHHAIHLRQLQLRKREHELVIYLEKCVFSPSSFTDQDPFSFFSGFQDAKKNKFFFIIYRFLPEVHLHQ
jgi:hypothetical protein